jgi:hypothetical protein
MRYTGFFLLLLVGVFAVAGCDGVADLEVDNENAPDRERAISNASDLKSALGGGYGSFWDGTYENDTPFAFPAPHLHGYGDAMTTTNAFAGFWSTATDEPRVPFQNTLSFADLDIVAVPWENLNSSLSSANTVIDQIDNNDFEVVIDGSDQTAMVRAGAYFLRALSYGHLANYFNQAYIVEADYDPVNDPQPDLRPYPEVLAQARADFNTVREIAGNNSFTLDDFLPFETEVSSQRLVRLANSFEARLLMSNARSPDEMTDAYWQDIRSLTRDGITQDLVMTLDGSTWFNSWQYFSGLYWYWRVDNRIIQKMDADYPIKYPADQAGSEIPPAQSDDQRLCPTSGESEAFDGVTFNSGDGIGVADALGCYFVYDTNQSFFRIARGPTLQSNYFFARDFVYEQWEIAPFAAGPGPIMLAAEDSLMEAEAELNLGNTSTAIQIVNDGSRTSAGGLTELSASASFDEVDAAIHYERDIELYRTGLGLPYYDLRRRGELQAGTPLQFPVPATELQTIGEELYTFGGANNAGQPGTASGDNAWCDQGDLSCDGPFEVPPAPQGWEPLSPAASKTMHDLGLSSGSRAAPPIN